MEKIKVKKSILAFMLIFFVSVSCFAQGALEDAYKNGIAESNSTIAELEKALAEAKTVAPSANGGMAEVTRPEISGHEVAHAGSPFAATVGYSILEKGGTAYDAAVAMAAAQTFAEPSMINIFGGDAEIIIYDAKEQKIKVYNGTGWAPANASLDAFLDRGGIPSNGILSMQMPGEWAGWMTLLGDYGTMTLADIFEPVIEGAEEGIGISPFLSLILSVVGTSVYNQAALDVFTSNGQLLSQGDLYKNVNYAALLREMANVASQGETLQDGYKLAYEYFYRGPIAEKIVEWNNQNGGIFSIEDFNEFYAEIQEPISTNYRGYDVYVCPPNSQGPTLIEALNILEGFDLASMEHNSAEYINIVAQALDIALNDRNKYVADPRFGTMPEEMMSKEYADKMRQYIDTEKAASSLPDGGLVYYRDYEALGGDTTFMAVADKYGNVVACTHSINGVMGSGLMVDGLGIMMNNRMTYYSLDFEHPNCLEPHKRTLQTITPTIATKDGKPAFFVGTPGSDNQEQTKLQVILNYVDFGMMPQQDVETARFVTKHAPAAGAGESYPGRIQVMGVGSKVIEDLTSMGYSVSKTTNTGSLGFGICKDGLWIVGADPTRDAYTVGR